jgi:hypothetical protein
MTIPPRDAGVFRGHAQFRILRQAFSILLLPVMLVHLITWGILAQSRAGFLAFAH